MTPPREAATRRFTTNWLTKNKARRLSPHDRLIVIERRFRHRLGAVRPGIVDENVVQRARGKCLLDSRKVGDVERYGVCRQPFSPHRASYLLGPRLRAGQEVDMGAGSCEGRRKSDAQTAARAGYKRAPIIEAERWPRRQCGVGCGGVFPHVAAWP